MSDGNFNFLRGIYSVYPDEFEELLFSDSGSDSLVDSKLTSTKAFRLAGLGRRFQKEGYLPLSVFRFFAMLSNGLNLKSVLTDTGLGGLSPTSRPFAKLWGELAKTIGLNIEEALLNMRLTFVENEAPQLYMRLVSSKRADGSSSLPLELNSGLAICGDKLLSQLSILENEVLKAFEEVREN